MTTRTCPECGAEFQPRYVNQVCCGDECQAARKKRLDTRHRRAYLARHATNAAAERKEKARRRAAFFAARDAAFERAGLPIPKIEVRGGVVTERRGQVPIGGCWRPF